MSGVFLLVAVPTAQVFVGEVASLLFVRRERRIVRRRYRDSIVGRLAADGADDGEETKEERPARRVSTVVPADYLAYLKDVAARSGRPVDVARTTLP